MRRTLTLAKETLTELTPGELGDVAGGATPTCPTFDGCYLPTDFCVSALDCLSRLMDPCLTYTCVCV